jgi:FKBP-type peptidyl-prolyl cis-trans isomerase FkpA
MKYLIIPFLAVTLLACKSQKNTTKTTDAPPPPPAEETKKVVGNSARYIIHKDVPGRNAKIGDIALVHVANYNAKDSLLYSTYSGMDPVPMEITKPEFRGDLMDAMVMASEGDSLSVLIPVDSLKDFQPVPGVVEMGQDIKLVIKVIKLMTKEQYTEYLNKDKKEQLARDTKLIEDYLKTNKIKASKTASGLYYIIEKKGTGPNAAAGQTVNVHYTGTLLNGKKFDSSRDRGQPFSFTLGQGQVIAGWDEGIALLNKGAQAKLFLPSSLGYGPNGAGADIPPNAVLIFDVELIDIQ